MSGFGVSLQTGCCFSDHGRVLFCFRGYPQRGDDRVEHGLWRLTLGNLDIPRKKTNEHLYSRIEGIIAWSKEIVMFWQLVYSIWLYTLIFCNIHFVIYNKLWSLFSFPILLLRFYNSTPYIDLSSEITHSLSIHNSVTCWHKLPGYH